MASQQETSRRNFIGGVLGAVGLLVLGIVFGYSIPKPSKKEKETYIVQTNANTYQTKVATFETTEVSIKPYLNEDFTVTRIYAQSHSYSDFETHLKGINAEACRIIRNDDEIVALMEKAVIHDDIWTETRRSVASNPFDALAIETYNNPDQNGLFIYDENYLSGMLYAIELKPDD